MIDKTSKRLFFGFEVNSLWPEQLPEGRIIDEKYRHVTVAFLGSVAEDQITKLTETIPKPDFKVGVCGLFDACLFLPENNPRVVAWHGSVLEEDKIASYHETLVAFLKGKDFSFPDRPFLNHISLARSPFDRKKWEETFISLPFITGALHLYESRGNLTYEPIWSFSVAQPFEEFEHVADIAFRVRGENVQQLYIHAQFALTFECPELIPYLDLETEVNSIEEVIIKLNEIVTHGDREIGTPFKAVSFHGDVIEEEFLTWEMIVDV